MMKQENRNMQQIVIQIAPLMRTKTVKVIMCDNGVMRHYSLLCACRERTLLADWVV